MVSSRIRSPASAWWFVWFYSLSSCPIGHAVMPTAEISVSFLPTSPSSSSFGNDNDRSTVAIGSNGRSSFSLLVSEASFGSHPPMKKNAVANNYPFTFIPANAPSDDPYLCKTDAEMVDYSTSTYEGTSTVMLVPRGICTFERKALNAQRRYNASAVIIYGNQASRYGYNETDHTVIYPQDKLDYDCQFGEGEIHTNHLVFNPAYDGSNNDGLVDQTCENNKCASNKCLLTGKDGKHSNNSPTNMNNPTLQTCCAWDLHLWLYGDPSLPKDEPTVDIPTLYVSMRQKDLLENTLRNSKDLQLKFYQRDRPTYNSSSYLIWALGVFTCALAAYLSGEDIRSSSKRIRSRAMMLNHENDHVHEHTNLNTRPSENNNVRSRSPRPVVSLSSNITSPTNHNHHNNIRLPPNSLEVEGLPSSNEQQQQHDQDEETLELTLVHALFFIVFSSASLFILFYFEIYGVVKCFYAFGCSGAISQILFRPLYEHTLATKIPLHRTVCHIDALDIGPVSYLAVLSNVTGYGVGLVWILTAFLTRDPSSHLFFWVVQDLMGMSICITFLKIIRINTLRVATVLLTVAFFYDIFFVFVTPYLFQGKSIMITVATSGGPPTADPTFCEKYPDDDGCQGGDPLPMLLTFPRLFDYQGGSSLLGLGDIVLPGLLLSFASRFDDAKRLMGAIGSNGSLSNNNRGSVLGCCGGNYYGPMVVAYAVGLMMANAAVYLMQMGQPALLYLVPMCLGCMFLVGFLNGEVWELWNGPKVLRAAESIVKGGSYVVETDTSSEEGEDNGLGPADVTEARSEDKEDHVIGTLT